jgi:hypothetical protein
LNHCPDGVSSYFRLALCSNNDSVLATVFDNHLTLPPITPGSGTYCGIPAASFPILFPIASNGHTAADTALLTFFAAIKATHMNTSAIRLMIIVPNIPPTESRVHWVVLIAFF